MSIYDDLKAKWDAAVNDFRDKEQQFRAAGEDLAANRGRYYAAGLGAQYENLMQRGQIIQLTVSKTLDNIAAIYDWFKSAVGLGVLPAIPFAALAIAVAAIGGFMLAYKALNAALQEYEIRQLPPAQQAEARRQILNQPTISTDIKQTIFGIAAIAAIVLILPKLIKQR